MSFVLNRFVCVMSMLELQTQKPNITQMYLFLLRDIITQNVSKQWDSFTVWVSNILLDIDTDTELNVMCDD